MKGTIASAFYKREWSNDKGTFHTYLIRIGDVEGEINSKEKDPSWLTVGSAIEVEVTETQYGKRFKRVTPQKGYKKPIMTKAEAMRMCKSNAVNAVSVVNAAYNSERLTGTDLAAIVSFTSERIVGDFEKYSDIDTDLISRLAAVNNAAIQANYRSYNTVKDLLDIAKKIYQYVSKP